MLTPSPDRTQPRCPIFGTCGGCQYQHLNYPVQLQWKSRQVGELMKHMAGLEFPVNECLSSEQIWNYRSKITPHFDKPRDGKIGEIGFRGSIRGRRIVDVPHCEIAMTAINKALPGIRQVTHENAHTFRRGSTLLIRAAENGIITDFNATAEERVGELKFRFLAGDFFQNNPFILQSFTGYVADRASETGELHLVDAYCGSGLFALSLAHRFKTIRGVEVSETSCDWARSNTEANGIANTTFLTASAEAIFASVDFPPEQTAVVIDPPPGSSS